eukprot:9403447-Lingulodinium_polyedra.AAC.1
MKPRSVQGTDRRGRTGDGTETPGRRARDGPIAHLAVRRVAGVVPVRLPVESSLHGPYPQRCNCGPSAAAATVTECGGCPCRL